MIPTFVAHECNYPGMYFLRQLEADGYSVRILRGNDHAEPHEVVLLGSSHQMSLSPGWEQGHFQIAAHRFIFAEKLPDYVCGPFVVKVRLRNGRVKKNAVRSLAKKYIRYFSTPTEITPWGTPCKVSRGWLKDWIALSERVLIAKAYDLPMQPIVI